MIALTPTAPQETTPTWLDLAKHLLGEDGFEEQRDHAIMLNVFRRCSPQVAAEFAATRHAGDRAAAASSPQEAARAASELAVCSERLKAAFLAACERQLVALCGGIDGNMLDRLRSLASRLIENPRTACDELVEYDRRWQATLARLAEAARVAGIPEEHREQAALAATTFTAADIDHLTLLTRLIKRAQALDSRPLAPGVPVKPVLQGPDEVFFCDLMYFRQTGRRLMLDEDFADLLKICRETGVCHGVVAGGEICAVLRVTDKSDQDWYVLADTRAFPSGEAAIGRALEFGRSLGFPPPK
eukprot:tig00000492_g1499.t1